MKYYATIISGDNLTINTNEFDRYSRAEKWARKQLVKLDNIFTLAYIGKYGATTGNEDCVVTILGCSRNFNGEITVS